MAEQLFKVVNGERREYTQAEYDEYNAGAAARAAEQAANNLTRAIESVNDLAGAKILAIFPEHKQRNYIARSVELTKKVADGGVLDAGELAEETLIQGLWDRVKAIRAHSDVLVAAVNADVNADITVGWPE